MEIKVPINIDSSQIIEEIKKEVLDSLKTSNLSKKLNLDGEYELESLNDDLVVVRLYGSQDLVKQNIILSMYKIGAQRIHELEEQGLERYPLGDQAVFYSIREVEDAIKKEARRKKRALNFDR